MAIGRIPEPGTGIPESIVDAKGDIVTATAADTPARLAVGTNEQRLVADSAAATGLKYVSDTTNYAVAAKGDLLVGTAADTVAVLSVGTNGHTLVADSSVSPTGLKWAAPAGGGKVLQVVYGNTTALTTSSTATLVDSKLTATITPSLATSKVLVMVSQNGVTKTNDTSVNLQLFRDATSIAKIGEGSMYTNTSLALNKFSFSISVLDEPATTSAIVYKTQIASADGIASVSCQNGPRSTIVLMEIGA